MKHPRTGWVVAAGAMALGALINPAAQAAFQDRLFSFPASAICDATNPALDTSVRRRSTELRNIGTTPLSVTCGLVTDDSILLGAMGQIAVLATNNRAVSQAMSCTLTAGTSQENQVSNKQTVTLAGESTGSIYWNATHYGSSRQHASFVCSLPSGWSLHEATVSYIEDVGL